MINRHLFNIRLCNANMPIECGMLYMNNSHSVEIKWNHRRIEIFNPKRSMGKKKVGNNDPLIRYMHGNGDEILQPTRYMLTVNCGHRIPFMNLLDVTNHVELFSFRIDHEEQIKIDEFIDNLPIPDQYPDEELMDKLKKSIDCI